MARAKKRGVIQYKSYLFVEKDPIIDALRTLHQDSGQTLVETEQASNVKASTMRSWFYGNVRRPQFATVSAVALALGARAIRFHGGKPRFDR